MANAEMKIFEAEKLHQPIIVAVITIPIMPLGKKKRKKVDKIEIDHFIWSDGQSF